MKSRGSSPQTSPVVRRIRVGSSDKENTPPALPGIRKPASIRMTHKDLPDLPAMSGYQSTTARDPSPQTTLLSPIPHGIRRVSGDATPARPILNGQVSSPAVTQTGGASPAATENESPSAGWSSAIGHATTSGKSGRVIERLMAENDRLKRDLEIANIRAQELEKSLSMVRPQMEALRAENENLSHARSVDSSLLSRRDRKIEGLKADNALKTERMEKAEAVVWQQQREMEELREEFSREQHAIVEQSKHATVHAEILETSHKQLSAEYRARREVWEHDLAQVIEDKEKDRQRMARLDVVYEQMRQEHERTRKVQAELSTRWEDMEQALHNTLQEGDQVNERARKKSAEMETVVKEMRWAVGLAKAGGIKDSPLAEPIPPARRPSQSPARRKPVPPIATPPPPVRAQSQSRPATATTPPPARAESQIRLQRRRQDSITQTSRILETPASSTRVVEQSGPQFNREDSIASSARSNRSKENRECFVL